MQYTETSEAPPSGWQVTILSVAAVIALVSLVLMALYLAALFLVPRTWMP